MGVYTRPSIVRNGLVLHLDAANMKSYPRSGTNWNDLSGNKYSGSLINGLTFANNYGGGIVFDGVNDYVNMGEGTSAQLIRAANKMTIHSVVYCTGYSNPSLGYSWSPILEIDDNAGPDRKVGLHINKSTITGLETITSVFFDASGTLTRTDLSVSSSVDTMLNKLLIVASTCDETDHILYLNGIPSIHSDGIAISTSSISPFTIGARVNTTYTGYFTGIVYSLCVYNRVLSAAEILQNYNATKGRFGL